MAKKIDLEQIISNNPQVRADELEESLEILRQLKNTGSVRQHTYSIETRDARTSAHYILSESFRTSRV